MKDRRAGPRSNLEITSMKTRLVLTHLCMIALLLWTIESFQSATAAGPFNVNDANDLVDDNPGNGICHTAAGTCALRAAMMEANKSSGATINLPAGVYHLTIPAT